MIKSKSVFIRWIAFLLVMVFALQSIEPKLVYALSSIPELFKDSYDPAVLDNWFEEETQPIINEPEDVFEIQTETLSSQALAILGSSRSYAMLTDKDKEILLMGLSLREDSMTTCANYGYSMEESIPLARIMQLLNITLDETLTMIENHNGEAKAMEEALAFRDMQRDSPILNNDDAAEIIKCIIEGYTAQKSVNAYAVYLTMDITAGLDTIVSGGAFLIADDLRNAGYLSSSDKNVNQNPRLS